jgi:type IV secretion system protein VirD4
VYAFALSGEGGDVFNPIMSIRANLNWAESSVEERCNEEEDASYIENLLFTPSDGNEDSFWDGSAKSFIKGVLLHVRTAELLTNADDRNDPDKQHRVRERSMREVRRLICLEPDSFASLLEDMGESQRPLISEAGNHLKKLVSDDGKIGLSIWATAKEQTKAWSFERVHQATYKPSGNPDGEPAPNDFTFEQLRDGNTSIYLIVPPEHLSMYRAVLRLIVGCALRELKDSHNKAKLDPEGDDKPPVLFLLDEFPQLAYMQPIEEAMAYMAGYGVRLWLFVQDIGQLKRHYKDAWQTFMANTEAKCFFGVNDIETATWLSETLGTTTVDDVTHTSGSSNTYPEFGNITYTNSSSVTTAHVARRLMTPDEIMRMPYHEQIILIKGLKPIFCDRPGYHECSLLNQSSKIPPLKLIDF